MIQGHRTNLKRRFAQQYTVRCCRLGQEFAVRSAGLHAKADQSFIVQFGYLEARPLVTDTVPVHAAHHALDVIGEAWRPVQPARRQVADTRAQ